MFLVVTAMLLLVGAAPKARADDAANLYAALLGTQPKQMPVGFSSATLGSMPLNQGSQQAGIMGIARISLAGGDTKGQIRYAVFSTRQDIEAYVREFSMPGNPIFFPYVPEAKCTSHGNQQACEITDGTVMIIAIITDLTEEFSSNHRRCLAKSALEHLRSVRTVDWATGANRRPSSEPRRSPPRGVAPRRDGAGRSERLLCSRPCRCIALNARAFAPKI